MYESVGKAYLLSDQFNGKQPRDSADLPLTCHPRVIDLKPLSSGRVRLGVSCYVHLDPYSGTDPLGMFPLFLKRKAHVLPPPPSIVSAECFGGFFVCVISLLPEDKPMSPHSDQFP